MKSEYGKSEKKPEASSGKAQKIVDEIVEKVRQYETSMSSFLQNVDEWGDLVRVRKPSKKNNSYSNPRLTEMFRAANTLSTTVYRMMTAQDPYFDTIPMDVLPEGDTGEQLLTIQGTLETQLLESGFKQNLLQACMSAIVFGTVIVQEDYKLIGVSSLGRRLPITTFVPRSMLQVAFDTSCTDIEDADWISTVDLISDCGILSLASQPDWNEKALQVAKDDQGNASDLAPEVIRRLEKYGYIQNNKASRKEMLCYYGKLDCLNDGVEYIVAIINRKTMVKFIPNTNQWGRRNLRVAVWIKDPLAIEPRGWGLGDIVGNLHKSLDSNRQKSQDALTMATYNMWERLRSAGIDDNDLKIRPLQIIDTDERGGLTPLRFDLAGAQAGLSLEELMRQEFRAASGATDSLQAIVTGATASETSLAQNEAMRMISVRAELMGEPLVRQHLGICHGNNAKYIKTTFTINRYLGPQKVYPKDLQADVDFKLKMTTDKDYKPKRLETLSTVLQTLVSTKSMHPELASLSIVPIVEEILRELGVPLRRLAGQPTQVQGPGMMAQPGQMPPMTSPNMSAPSDATLRVPIGEVMASPQGGGTLNG